ncbi:hypothetical protein VNI00_005442 [Paramarasmius palmivorus]|uniref:AB hydrolase-1 domain-containing protein n=1 Tax=Paramarasmius palmivorus TaxID=297713 RepID=A0AAW0DFE4_9AGAR
MSPYDDTQHPASHPPLLDLPSCPENVFQTPFPVSLATVSPPPHDVLPLHLPQLPSSQRTPIWANDPRIPYTLSTHIVPAAYWREDPDDTLPQAPNERQAKQMKEQTAVEAETRLRELRQRAEQGKGEHKVLWLVFNRYVREYDRTQQGGLTLFCAHATGSHKEAFEPTLASLLSSRETQSLIQEIWVWDGVNHGDSALLNAGKLNSLFSWRNSARDILTFLIYYLPISCAVGSLPTHLPTVSEAEVTKRRTYGFYDPAQGKKSRTVVGIGHSYGGCVSTLAALSSPRPHNGKFNTNLFSLLILVDPVIIAPGDYASDITSYVRRTLLRRTTWPSRAAATESFLKSPMYPRWDARVLELYLESALYEDHTEKGIVRLKQPAICEAIIYTDIMTGSPEAWVRLRRGELDKDVGLRWVVPGVGQPE